MDDYNFISESSNIPKLRSFIITATVAAIFVALGILYLTIWNSYFPNILGINSIVDSVKEDIAALNLKGLFYAHLVGGIFFVPSPDEAIFYYGLVKGNAIALAFIVAVTGYLIAQVINYFLGYALSDYMLHMVSKKKIYKARRFANKYGIYGILFLNLVPAPAPLLTIALGLAKYNFSRLMFWTAIGKFMKYGIVIAIFIVLN